MTLAGGAALVVAFALVERRVDAPILPLWVFTRRVLLASSLVSVCVGAVVLGLTSYVPTFAQGVLGAGPVTAGFALATLTIGWPLAAAYSGRLYLRIGFRLTALVGSALAVAGSVAVIFAASAESLAALAVACFVVGAGLGFIASPTLIAAQSSVGWAERGVVTGSNLFARSLGSAVAVAGLGAVANAVIDGGVGGGAQPSGQLLADASHAVFVAVAVVAFVMVGAIVMMPGRSAATSETGTQEPAEAVDDREAARAG